MTPDQLKAWGERFDGRALYEAEGEDLERWRDVPRPDRFRYLTTRWNAVAAAVRTGSPLLPHR